jgi:hypothetical protein
MTHPLTEAFKLSKEYRHWIACCEIAAVPNVTERRLRSIVREALPSTEHAHWDSICDQYDANEQPAWLKEELG